MKDRIIGALETGCRCGEMLKIRNLDVDWTKHRITLPARNAKSAKGRVIPVDPQARLPEVLRRRRFLGTDAFAFGAWMTGEAVDGFRGAWESVLLLSMGEKIERAHREADQTQKP